MQMSVKWLDKKSAFARLFILKYNSVITTSFANGFNGFQTMVLMSGIKTIVSTIQNILTNLTTTNSIYDQL